MPNAEPPNLFARLVAIAIYVGLAIIGAILFFWGFLFAVGAAVAIFIFFLFMRLFGLAPNKRANPFARASQPADSTHPKDASKKEDVIELQRKSDGSYE